MNITLFIEYKKWTFSFSNSGIKNGAEWKISVKILIKYLITNIIMHNIRILRIE